jgi:hypothetical protein
MGQWTAAHRGRMANWWRGLRGRRDGQRLAITQRALAIATFGARNFIRGNKSHAYSALPDFNSKPQVTVETAEIVDVRQHSGRKTGLYRHVFCISHQQITRDCSECFLFELIRTREKEGYRNG